MISRLLSLLFAFLALASPGVAGAAVGWYVDLTHHSIGCQYPHIQDAINAAHLAGRFGAYIYATPGAYTDPTTIAAVGRHVLRPGNATCTGVAAAGSKITLNGPAAGTGSIIEVPPGWALWIYDAILTGGSAAGDGGDIDAEGAEIYLTDVDLKNGAATNGGCLAVGSAYGTGIAYLYHVTFTLCDAENDGGGLYDSYASSVTLNDVDFTDCDAGINGGGAAVYLDDYEANEEFTWTTGTATGCFAVDNFAQVKHYGGTLYVYSPDLPLDKATATLANVDISPGKYVDLRHGRRRDRRPIDQLRLHER